MLQQTRVAAVIPYYEKFLARFPSIQSLADAPEPDLLSHWAGLGYYTRARNLQKAAQQMADGVFPSAYEEIRALAGIGDYTAAAVASISFNLPYAVVDGNVLRVIARLTNDDANIADPATRRRFAATAQRMLDTRQPGEYNQAIMELGATVCTPRNPQCGTCPVSRWCEARVAGTQATLPVKVRRQKQERIALHLLVVENRAGAILIKPSRRVAGFWICRKSQICLRRLWAKIRRNFTPNHLPQVFLRRLQGSDRAVSARIPLVQRFHAVIHHCNKVFTKVASPPSQDRKIRNRLVRIARHARWESCFDYRDLCPNQN